MKRSMLEDRFTNLELEYRLMKLEKMILEKVVSGKMPKYFYHGTTAKAADMILKQGLSPAAYRKAKVVHSGLTNPNKVYVCSDLKQARSWADLSAKEAGEPIVVLQIYSKYMDPDKLEGDINALIASADDYGGDLPEDEWDTDEDGNPIDPMEDAEDSFKNLRFDTLGMDTYDFEYDGKIPPEAITIVWESGDTSEIVKALDNFDIKTIIKNWDDWKDRPIGSKNVASSFAFELMDNVGVPTSWDNPKLKDLLLSLPAKVLNAACDTSFGSMPLLLKAQSFPGNYAQDILESIADKKGISDETIKALWKVYAKTKQSKNIDRISKLPHKFLEIGKPYIAKKYYTQLGI